MDRPLDFCDLHLHTRWSDGLASPAQVVERARALQIRVAITDHNVVEGALQAWTLAGDDARDLVVPGIELTTEERIHLLLWFRDPKDLHDYFQRAVAPFRSRGGTATTPLRRPVADLLQDAQRYEHAAGAAHPYAIARNGWMTVRERFRHIGDLLADLHAVEVINGQELDGGNAQAAALATERGFARVAGSDAHTLGEIGTVGTLLPRGQDVVEALRAEGGDPQDRRDSGLWRRLALQSAKAPYYARKPGRFAVRWASGSHGDGPLTRDGLTLERPLPP